MGRNLANDYMKPLIRISLIVVGIVALLIGSAVAYLAVAGDDFYRWAARQIAHNAVGQEVHFDGKFTVQIGLSPTIEAADIWIENTDYDERNANQRIHITMQTTVEVFLAVKRQGARKITSNFVAADTAVAVFVIQHHSRTTITKSVSAVQWI